MKAPITINTGLAVNLLLEGRAAVVVGGGVIGLRKARLLLEAGAVVTVIAPELCPELHLLSKQKTLVHVAKRFESGDLAGAAVVFAATDNRSVNRQVLEEARRTGALVCAADANWPDGDFLTPASVRRGGLQVSVSTGGRSCRQSRLVKDSLSRHLTALETAELVVVGTSHELLTAAERECFHLDEDARKRVGTLIRQLRGVHEFFLINTCNRIEVIAVATPDDETIGLLEKLLGIDRLDAAQRHRKIGPAAFEHLGLMAAGMLSQAVGESHITAQLKDAAHEAVRNGWAAGMMREWADVALHVSKNIRTAVAPLLKVGEIEDVCLAYLSQNRSDSIQDPVLVIGSGVIGRSLAEQTFRRGYRCVWCYHINRPDVPPEWAEHVELCRLDHIHSRLGEVQVVLSAVEAPGYVLREEDAPFFNPDKKILVVDLAMPRTVDPRLADQVPGLQVVDLDGLKNWQRLTSGVMEKVMNQSRAIVREHHGLYERIQQSIQGGLADEPAGADPVG